MSTQGEDHMANEARRPQINFAISGDTLETIEDLKRVFGVDTNTAVLRRALAIAKLAGAHQREDHTVTLLGKDDVRRDIVLNG